MIRCRGLISGSTALIKTVSICCSARWYSGQIVYYHYNYFMLLLCCTERKYAYPTENGPGHMEVHTDYVIMKSLRKYKSERTCD